MPDFTAEDAASDAMRAFQGITSLRKSSRLILVGSSSGGQLAAQVSQDYTKHMTHRGITNRIHGVLLRASVTCNATDGRIDIPSQFRPYHTSMSSAFHTSLLSGAAVNASNRASVMPLEAESFSGLPRYWIQVCTNDIYYSDGVCYAEVLRDAGVKVKLDVVEGWPHTFWLRLLIWRERCRRKMVCLRD
jgi:acetyl esterase/lipase